MPLISSNFFDITVVFRFLIESIFFILKKYKKNLEKKGNIHDLRSSISILSLIQYVQLESTITSFFKSDN